MAQLIVALDYTNAEDALATPNPCAAAQSG